jgi:4-hydroxybenzoate polyprenyltransferase
MRPQQWSKSVFVLIGPTYALSDPSLGLKVGEAVGPALGAAAAFALFSSVCYVFNDLMDAEQDRSHPRKRNRPIASGAVGTRAAVALAVVLAVVGTGVALLAPGERALYLGMALATYVANVLAYSAWLKHKVIADVLRVLGGCAAVGVVPSVWLLNCTFFLSMFLAFGKRLGERRMLGDKVSTTRLVQRFYTDNLLEMAVVVTAVATLVTYTGYIERHAAVYEMGFSLLWLTVLPATYALFRCIVMLDAGRFDDPTELAIRDRPFQIAALVFAGGTLGLIWWFRLRG